MKKFIFTFFFFSLMAAGLQAQKSSCAKSCTKSSSASVACQAKAPAAASTETEAAAAKLASMDATIETKKCPATGTVSYAKKVTNQDGQVSLVDVTYDANTNSFVNVAPSKMEGSATGTGCSPTKAVGANGKACCASTASAGKSCCAGKATGVKSAEKVKS